jgi:hypothetical protein
MSRLDRAQAALNARLGRANGVRVSYTRGAETIALTAVVGQTIFASNAVDKAAVVIGDRDYLIAVADLTFGVPKRGDKITEVIDGVAVVFEVEQPSASHGSMPDEPACRYSGPSRVTWRIHVKRKG